MRRIFSILIVALLLSLGSYAKAAQTVTVHVFSFGFSINAKGGAVVDPIIFIGDTIHWVWDEGTHDSVSDAGQKENWKSTLNGKGKTYDHTFTNEGTFTYFCTPHKSIMKGKIFVLDPAKTIDTITFNPASVKGGKTSTGTVTLKANAAADVVVTLTSSNTAVATVPASVTIKKGTKSITFTATTKTVTADTTVTINGQVGTAAKVPGTLKVTKN